MKSSHGDDVYLCDAFRATSENPLTKTQYLSHYMQPESSSIPKSSIKKTQRTIRLIPEQGPETPQGIGISKPPKQARWGERGKAIRDPVGFWVGVCDVFLIPVSERDVGFSLFFSPLFLGGCGMKVWCGLCFFFFFLIRGRMKGIAGLSDCHFLCLYRDYLIWFFILWLWYCTWYFSAALLHMPHIRSVCVWIKSFTPLSR